MNNIVFKCSTFNLEPSSWVMTLRRRICIVLDRIIRKSSAIYYASTPQAIVSYCIVTNKISTATTIIDINTHVIIVDITVGYSWARTTLTSNAHAIIITTTSLTIISDLGVINKRRCIAYI